MTETGTQSRQDSFAFWVMLMLAMMVPWVLE